MIRVPEDLRNLAEGSSVNLFVSVGQTSRRLKGTVDEVRERGTDGEVTEVHVSEGTPGASEIVFWLGFAGETTYLLPLDGTDDDLVYVEYRHDGGQTGLYVDRVRDVRVRQSAARERELDGPPLNEGKQPRR